MNKERDENTKCYLFKENYSHFPFFLNCTVIIIKKSSSVNASSEVFINLIITLVLGVNFTIFKF